jgi:hypothetical protein
VSNSTPIETRIEDAIHDLLDYMNTENTYSEDYKSMFTQLTKVMELRQKEHDSAETRNVKMLELSQQKELAEASQETKLTELQQQRLLSNAANEIKMHELEQQKAIADDANNIKLSELEQRNTVTKEAWLNVGTHLAGLIVLMNHERAHVIASKAFGFVRKIF